MILLYYSNGKSFYELGKYEEAIIAYDKAIELKPDYAESYNNKGNSVSNCGRDEEAIECYDKAIRLNPNYVEAINNKSIVIQKLGSAGDAKCM